jgi:hypothetical protein
MKVVVTGQGNITAGEIGEAFEHFNLKPKTVLSPGETPVEEMAGSWAESNKVKVDVRKPKWGDMTVEKCTIKQNRFGKDYNSRAAFNRNDELVADCDCVLMINDHSRSSASIVEAAEKLSKTVYKWPVLEDDDVPF